MNCCLRLMVQHSLLQPSPQTQRKPPFLYSILGLRTLACGMIAFTLLMGIDIFTFGWDMKQLNDPDKKKRYWFSGSEKVTPLSEGVFRKIGMTILIAIVALIVAGWGCVAWYAPRAVPG